ncbi:MAG: ribonuclease J [Alphaproteobacteria bacterium]|nr:ribonuclease J [Alphaproteobacteria bacterium]
MHNTPQEGFYFLPLGGADDIGMNMYAYGANDKWIVVDAGYGFLGDEYKGMDMCYVSPDFLVERKENIEGLFITHGHEDHMGAIAHILDALHCKVYATPFVAELMKERLEEFGLALKAEIEEVAEGSTIQTETFEVEYISLAHSVPESCGLFIQTPHGNIFHATDWRFDDGRLDMIKTDYEALKKIAQKKVTLFVCDSTNIFVDHQQPSEFQIRQNLLKLVPTIKGGLVATCFASNLMRLESLILAADLAGRTPILLGKTLHTNIKLAQKCGYFKELPKAHLAEAADDITSDKALYICTGSQANYHSALAMIANGENKYVKLGQGDTVLFSSKIIPGNEEKIKRMQEKLIDKGVSVVTEDEQKIHTTGHCSKDELKKMYDIIKPEIVFPVHGDRSFIREHRAFAYSCGISHICSGKNGDLFFVSGEHISYVEKVPVDVMGVDHKRSVSLHSEVVKNRVRIAYHCSLFASVVLSKENQVVDLQISSKNILEQDDWDALVLKIKPDLVEQLSAILEKEGLNQHTEELMKSAIRKAVYHQTDIKPVTIMHIYQEQ